LQKDTAYRGTSGTLEVRKGVKHQVSGRHLFADCYDEEHDLFRFPEEDGRFAFSKEWADESLLQRRGY